MSYSFYCNVLPSGTIGGTDVMFNLKANLKTAGWTVTYSSDGSTANTGDVVTSNSTGANGLQNTKAYFVLQSPSGSPARQISIQRGTTDVLWRIKYSPQAGFLPNPGPNPDTIKTPTATDEKILFGGGTDASPTFGTLFDATGSGFHSNMAVGGSTEKYAFYLFTVSHSPVNITMAFALDPMQTGSFPTADPDPVVVYLQAFNNNIFGSDLQTTPVGLLGNTVVSIPALPIGSTYPGGLLGNPFTGKDDYMPVPWGRDFTHLSPVGHKGVSSLLQWAGLIRAPLVTLNMTTAKDHIFIGQVALPWNGSDPVT